MASGTGQTVSVTFRCGGACRSNFSMTAESSWDGLTSTRCRKYSYICSWWWVELPPETCRAVYRIIINCIFVPCWTVTDIVLCMVFGSISYLYYKYFISSCYQMGILHLKWIRMIVVPVFFMVLSIPASHRHWNSIVYDFFFKNLNYYISLTFRLVMSYIYIRSTYSWCF